LLRQWTANVGRRKRVAGIIGGIFGGFARPMTTRVSRPAAAAATDQSATGQHSNLPVVVVAPRSASRTPIPHDLFVNQFTTPSTAAVASHALAAPVPDQQSLTELKAHSTYLAVAAEGN
jgi:hypothetical protein